MPHAKVFLAQVVVAAVIAAFLLHEFAVGFATGDSPVTSPSGWEAAMPFIFLTGLLAVSGLTLALSAHRFPWLVPVLLPALIRIFMLQPSQLDLYELALRLGLYGDLVFVIGAAIGLGVLRWQGRRSDCADNRFAE